mmetsp:Transcript_7514/g.9807  ORF Transcript_7514/g.9807 Transcript_7514/m.9807 type:complete len:816 (+) Transcript_7514:74-2521(+)
MGFSFRDARLVAFTAVSVILLEQICNNKDINNYMPDVPSYGEAKIGVEFVDHSLQHIVEEIADHVGFNNTGADDDNSEGESTIQTSRTMIDRAVKLKKMSDPPKFVVWMFPFPPTQSAPVLSGETLICAYSNACPQKEERRSINLKSLTTHTKFHNYVRDQAWFKVRDWQSFPKNIQIITMLVLLDTHKGACVRALGSSVQTCDSNAYQDYDPYEEDLGSSHFPAKLLQKDETNGSSTVVPDLDATKFAVYGIYPNDNNYRAGSYNSGDDVQSIASAHWLPYVNDIRHRKDALLNFTGYVIGNALINHLTTPNARDLDSLKRVSLLSIFIGDEKLLKANKPFFKYYSENGEAFGSRSTLTNKMMLKHEVKSYFSACLTITINMQGGGLVHNAKQVAINNQEMIKPPLEESPRKDLVLMVDTYFDNIPKHIKENGRRLYANIPKKFPGDLRPYDARAKYAYRLLSQYAKDAKVVITSRIHVGLPALAMGIPVVFITNGGWLPGGHQRTGRVSGLIELFHLISSKDPWPFGNTTTTIGVGPNPGNHVADRYRASFWNRFKRASHFYEDNAKMLGMIPFQRLGRDSAKEDTQDTFHFLLQVEDMKYWQTKRAIEHVFFFHPNARVYIHSNDLTEVDLEIFVESGYDLVVQRYDVVSLGEEAKLVPLDNNQVKSLLVAARLVLWKYGGVVIAKNTFLRKPIPRNIDAGTIMRIGGTEVEMMIYPRFATVLGRYLKTSSTTSSLTQSWKVNVLSEGNSMNCYTNATWDHSADKSWTDEGALAISVEPSVLFSRTSTTLGTMCYELLESICIFCDEVHIEF